MQHTDEWNGTPAAVTELPSFRFDNQRSTDQTVAEMGRMAARAARAPAVQRWAGLSLAGSLGPLDRRGVCGAVFRAVRAIPFEHDERQLAERFGLSGPELDRELLVAPEVLIEQQRPRGDCDCKAMLGAACLLALGIPCCFTVLDRSGRKWEHVYVQAALEDGSLYPLDFSHGPMAGWQAGGAVRRGNAPMMRPPLSDDVLKRHAREHAAMRRRGLSGLGRAANPRMEQYVIYAGKRILWAGDDFRKARKIADAAVMSRPPLRDVSIETRRWDQRHLKKGYRKGYQRLSRGLSGLGFESTGGGGPSWWQQLLATGAQTGFRIAEGRFGAGSVPTFEMLQLPDGTQTVTQRGGGAFLNDPIATVGSINPLWLVGGAGLLFLMLKK